MRKFAFLFLWVATAQAAELEQARKHFEWMEYDKAEALATRALTSNQSGPQEVVEAYRIIGLCQSARGLTKQAKETFLRLLALQPDYSFGEEISPKLLGPFEQAQKARGKESLELRHASSPPLDSLAGAGLKISLPANPFGLVEAVRLRWREAGAGPWQEQVRPLKSPGDFFFQLPASLGAAEIEYRFEALNSSGAVLKALPAEEPLRLKAASPTPPLTVGVAGPRKPERQMVPPPAGEDDYRERSLAPTPWWKSWWFWTAVGVLVAGGVTAGAVVATRPGSGPADYQIIFR